MYALDAIWTEPTYPVAPKAFGTLTIFQYCLKIPVDVSFDSHTLIKKAIRK